MMRTLVIGLDGCSWNVLEPLLETGQLPSLAALREEGAHGVLESTIPFFTGPAWVSYATGASPAAHGVYDFMMLQDDGTLRVASQSDVRRKTYYQQLGLEGKRSVLINLPLDQAGSEGSVIVNSWLTDDNARRILPVGRRERYSRLLEAYRTFPADPTDFDDLCAIEEARFDLARELFLAEEWDHFFVLFSSTDWLGHELTGKFLAGDRDAHAAVRRLYAQIDRYVGWFLEHAPDATAAVVSDHGQCAEKAVLRVNAILKDLGLARLVDPRTLNDPFFVKRWPKPRFRLRLPGPVTRARSNPLVRPVASLTKRALRRAFGVDVTRASYAADRVSSRAFMPTDASFAIYMNGDDDDALRRIRDALTDVRLDDGTPAIDHVWTPEELYGRPSAGRAPALLFSPALGVRPSATVMDVVVDQRNGQTRGCHQRDGIVLLRGPEVRRTELDRSSICDLAPTLLWAMGAGIPTGGDGRVLFEAFVDSFAVSQPVTEVDPEAVDVPEGYNGHADEVARRLKALGYI